MIMLCVCVCWANGNWHYSTIFDLQRWPFHMVRPTILLRVQGDFPHKVMSQGLSEEVVDEQRPEYREGTSHVETEEQSRCRGKQGSRFWGRSTECEECLKSSVDTMDDKGQEQDKIRGKGQPETDRVEASGALRSWQRLWVWFWE